MPSLSALNEFRDSFSNIANEREDLASKGIPYSALDLPDTEAPPFEQPSRAPAGSPVDSSTDTIAADTGAGAGMGDFDLGALLGSVPTDTPPPPDDNIPGASFDDLFSDTAPQTEQPQSTDDFLSSLGIDSPTGDTPAADTPITDTPTEETPTDVGSSDISSADASPADVSPAKTPDLSSPPAGESFPADDFLSSPNAETSHGDAFPSDDFLDTLGTGTPAEKDKPSTPEDDFSVPPDLLSGLGEEIESAPSDFPTEETPAGDAPAEDTPAGDFTPTDLTPDELPSDDFSTEASPAEENIDEGVDLGGERQDGTLSTDSGKKGFMPSKDDDDALTDTPISETDDLDGALADNALNADSPESEPPSTDFDLPEASSDESIDLGGESRDTDETSADKTSADETSGDVPSDDFASADLTSADILSDDAGLDMFDLPDMDIKKERPVTEDFGYDNEDSLTDTSLPDETEFTQAEPESLPDIPDLPDVDFDITEPSSPAGDGASSEPLNMADFGEDFASESIDLENAPQHEPEAGQAPAATFSDDDFALPGLDDIFEKSKIDTTPKPAQKKGFFKRKKAEPVVEEEEHGFGDSDEIKLSQSDLDKLLATLASYPINLRVACEELIAEQVILPKQLSKLLRMLIRGANVKEMAEFAGQILGKEIIIPRSYEKSTGAELEAEKASFAYIFVHNFLPVLRIVGLAAALLASTIYLGYKFIYLPLKADSLYKRGYERIGAGEYQRANELFHEAFTMHRKKKWFYSYAEGFRDQRRYLLAENKYDELLRYYPRDKKGVLDYAKLETYYLLNYEKANKLLQNDLLDYAPDDYDGLLAAGDNFLAWADSDPSKFYDKYEDARFCYARILQENGWSGPVLERMLLYFIHTDNLKETLNLRAWFENNRKKAKLTTPTLAELGGYLLDKQLEKVKGVPNAYVESIESVRDMLLQAVREDPYLPEPHYHLARYYNNLGNLHEERLTLENAIRAYDLAKTESVRRRLNRVDTHYRYANLLINNKEFFPAEEQLVKGIELYEDFVSRNLIKPSPQLGQLYAGLGDLEYFVKSGNIQAALNNYLTAEKNGYSPPEIQYRIGASYYQQEKWGNALDYLFKASSALPLNRRILFALGNTAYKRGDYFASQGYYNRLLDILENQRIRLPVLLPNDSAQFLELGERLMMARNNAGVVNEALAKQTGKREYRSKAMALYADSARSWDAITRNPESMTRMSIGDNPGAPSINLGYLNANNALHPSSGFTPEIFIRIDKDVSEPSKWEELVPFGGLVN